MMTTFTNRKTYFTARRTLAWIWIIAGNVRTSIPSTDFTPLCTAWHRYLLPIPVQALTVVNKTTTLAMFRVKRVPPHQISASILPPSTINHPFNFSMSSFAMHCSNPKQKTLRSILPNINLAIPIHFLPPGCCFGLHHYYLSTYLCCCYATLCP